MKAQTTPPVNWRKAVANPMLPGGASLMVPVADLRELLGAQSKPAQVQRRKPWYMRLFKRRA